MKSRNAAVSPALTEALIGTYRGLPIHAPGRVLTDLAAAVVDGESSIGGVETLGNREEVFGPWLLPDRLAGAGPGH